MDGVNFITDPIFSDRCSPVQFFGPKRYRRVPLEIEQLPPLDFVILSHNHYDHLDKVSVRRIGNKPTWFVPVGLKSWFADLGITNVVELTWWQEHQFNEKIKVVLFPVQHWSNRGTNSFESLWGGYGVISPERRVFFSGDTGYCSVFKTIGKHYGPFDLSLIAIGAYCPRDFMRPQHIDPKEAVQVHEDLKSKKSLGIHWGTFILTDEPEDEPPKLLRQEAAKKNLGENDFVVTRIGETRIVGKETSIEN